jgi:hypothetical protein
MKNQKEKIDLLFKSELEGFDIAPPPEMKEKIFIEMAASGMYDNKRRNLLITLVILFISSIAVFSVIFFQGGSSGKSGNTSNIIISKAELPSREISNVPQNNNEEVYNNHIKNSSTKIQNDQNIISENKTAVKNENNIFNTNNKNAKTNINPNSDKSANSSQEIISENPKVIVTEDYSVTEKKENSNNVNSPLPQNSFLAEMSRIQNLESFSIYDGKINSNIVKKVKSKQPLILSLGFNAGHSITQQPVLNLSKSDNEDNNKYIYKMDWPSGSIGLNVKLEKKHFFGEVGLQLSKFTEKISTDKMLTNPYGFHTLEISGQNEQVDSTGYYHYFYISDSNIRVIDSVWAWEIDTSFYNTYDDVYKTAYDTLLNPSWKNSYTFIDMPLFFGWQMNFGRFNLGIKTGPIINMLLTVKGNMPIRYNNTVILGDMKEEFKKYQFGLSWQAAATLGYFMTSNLVLECSPYYRFTILGIKPVSTGAEIKNNSFGLQLGLRYYF